MKTIQKEHEAKVDVLQQRIKTYQKEVATLNKANNKQKSTQQQSANNAAAAAAAAAANCLRSPYLPTYPGGSSSPPSKQGPSIVQAGCPLPGLPDQWCGYTLVPALSGGSSVQASHFCVIFWWSGLRRGVWVQTEVGPPPPVLFEGRSVEKN